VDFVWQFIVYNHVSKPFCLFSVSLALQGFSFLLLPLPAKRPVRHLSVLRQKSHSFSAFLVPRSCGLFPFLQKFGKQHKLWLLNVEKMPLVTS
jgi:hypothetical protein